MSNELTTGGQGQDLAAVMEWARAAQNASIVPEAYRGKPADMMIAANLGASMGLSPAESLYRIAVIKGKPTASAELIASKVREAGHRLRIEGDDTSATCTIIRSDDPDYEFKETRDIKWAERMGLTAQPNYKKQPATMLKNRAITACARLACPEALYGVAYTPDEIQESPDFRTSEPVSVAEAIAVEQVEAEPDTPTEPAADEVAGTSDLTALGEMWKASGPERRAQIEARVAELKAASEPTQPTLDEGADQ